MTCPHCGGNNVTVSIVQDSGRTRRRGCLWGIGRMLLIVCTLGLWLLIGKTKSKTTFQSHKEAVCQSCGKSWRV